MSDATLARPRRACNALARMLIEVLLVVLGVAALLVGALVVGAPTIVVALVRARATGERPWAFVYALVNGVLASVALGVAGLVWSMGVASEDAGTILQFLVTAGCVGGFVAGVVVTLPIVWLGGRALAKRAGA